MVMYEFFSTVIVIDQFYVTNEHESHCATIKTVFRIVT